MTMNAFNLFLGIMSPVSYTHLSDPVDVYLQFLEKQVGFLFIDASETLTYKFLVKIHFKMCIRDRLCGSCHRFQLRDYVADGRKLQPSSFRCPKYDCQSDGNDL